MAKGRRGGRQADHDFAKVPSVQIPRSVFSRSHAYKTTFDAGKLIPFYVDEVLPGDTFKVDATFFARLNTVLFPVMDNLYLDVFYFFIPYRLVWDNWVRFMGEQDNPADSISFLQPVVTDPVVTIGSLGDYMGLPFGSAGVDVSALPFRAYNLVFNQWFRDENLVNSVPVLKTDGPDPVGNYTLLTRGKRHDYFTSALPWPQKGAVPVTIPLGTSAPVRGIGVAAGSEATGYTNVDLANVKESGGTSRTYAANWAIAGSLLKAEASTEASGTSYPTIFADLSVATAATVNALRQAFQVQKLLERDARGGTRYTEIIRAHFKVVSPDARLNRPEFLGGGTIPVIVTPVQNTGAPTITPFTLRSTTGGYGVAVKGGLGFNKSFTEHGCLLGLVMARADLTYQQGIQKFWFRRTKLDHYWPALAHLGEQTVLNKEIYAKNDGNDDLVFGYQERHAEYRYFPSMITGQFRSSAPGGDLDDWHLAQEFTALPVLNSVFISEDPPIDRVSAVATDPHFRMDVWMGIRAARPMPTFAVPGLIDHF